MRILLTGASGYLGRLLTPALLAHTDRAEVLGTDRVPPAGLPPAKRYAFQPLDLVSAGEAELDALLAGQDLVIHLAFQMTPRPGQRLEAINVQAQERFLSAVAARVPRLVVASAIAAYGFAPGRDPHAGMLSEDTPLAPGAGVAYADHKQALERLLDRLEATTALEIVRARPTNVGGPGIDPKRAPQLSGPVMLAPATRHPLRQQLIHEADFTSAMLTLIDAPPGAYNIGPDDWLTLEDAARMLGQRYVPMPGWILRGLVDVAWRSGTSLFDPSWLAFLEHPPIIVSNAKLRALGWKARHGTADTLRIVADKVRAR